jgi:hypothetical protein
MIQDPSLTVHCYENEKSSRVFGLRVFWTIEAVHFKKLRTTSLATFSLRSRKFFYPIQQATVPYLALDNVIFEGIV